MSVNKRAYFCLVDMYNNCTDSVHQMPELIDIWVFDPGHGWKHFNSSNNPEGVFHFPYYERFDGDACGLEPNMNDLVEDLNSLFTLASTFPNNPNYENYYGHACIYDSYDVPPGNICKFSLAIENTGLGFYELKADNKAYDVPACDWIPDSTNCGVVYVTLDLLDYPDHEICTTLSQMKGNLVNIIETKDNNLSVDYYPTITSGIVQLEWDIDLASDKEITIYKISGEKIKTIRVDNRESSKIIDLTNNTNGVYLVKIMDLITGSKNIIKIVKN